MASILLRCLAPKSVSPQLNDLLSEQDALAAAPLLARAEVLTIGDARLLTGDDFRELGVRIGVKNRILRGLAAYEPSAPAAGAPTAPAAGTASDGQNRLSWFRFAISSGNVPLARELCTTEDEALEVRALQRSMKEQADTVVEALKARARAVSGDARPSEGGDTLRDGLVFPCERKSYWKVASEASEAGGEAAAVEDALAGGEAEAARGRSGREAAGGAAAVERQIDAALLAVSIGEDGDGGSASAAARGLPASSDASSAPAAAEALLAAGSVTHDGWRPPIARQAGASEVDEALVALGAGVLLSRCRSQQRGLAAPRSQTAAEEGGGGEGGAAGGGSFPAGRESTTDGAGGGAGDDDGGGGGGRSGDAAAPSSERSLYVSDRPSTLYGEGSYSPDEEASREMQPRCSSARRRRSRDQAGHLPCTLMCALEVWPRGRPALH